MQHELVKELHKSKRKALCVVTGVVKTTGPATISATLAETKQAETKVSFRYKPLAVQKAFIILLKEVFRNQYILAIELLYVSVSVELI